jgi:apolipoprotein N-acyltransferase
MTEAAEAVDDTERADEVPALGPFVKAALRRALPRQVVAIVAGLLLCASFPPLGWWYAAFVAFALLAWVLTRESTKLRGGFGYGFLFGLAFYMPLLPWISGLVGAVPWLVLAVVCAVFPGLFGVAAVAVRRLPGWPLWFAALWAGQEWLKCTIPFGGFPWGVVGFSQTDGPLLAVVRLGGVPLLSFAVVLVGFSVTAIAIEVYQWLRRGEADTGSDAPPEVVVPGICIAVVLLGTAAIWPDVRQSGTGAGNDPTVTVAAVQGNVPRLGLDFNAQRRAVLDYHVRETVRLADEVRAGRAMQPQFVIWPENSSDIDPLQNDDAAQQISVAAQSINAPILVGSVLARPDWAPENPVSTNSVIVWDPIDGPGERHDKQIVQPFGEYLPWRAFFRHLSGYADRAGYFVPGRGSGVVHAAGVPVGVTTCWEVIFDRAARASVRNGAQVLAVPSNNATFNEAMSEQQLAFGKERAVEHNRYVVVAGTTGISAVIAPDGRELARTSFFQPAYLDKQIRLRTTLTPATRWGPIVEAVLVATGGAALFVAILHNGWFMRRRRPGGNDDTVPNPGPHDTDRGAT